MRSSDRIFSEYSEIQQYNPEKDIGKDSSIFNNLNAPLFSRDYQENTQSGFPKVPYALDLFTVSIKREMITIAIIPQLLLNFLGRFFNLQYCVLKISMMRIIFGSPLMKKRFLFCSILSFVQLRMKSSIISMAAGLCFRISILALTAS